jgi:hypothetical protein
MGKHERGKHRLVTSNVRARIGAASVIVALGLTGGALASPIASAAPATQQVALQAFSTPLLTNSPKNNRGDDHRGDRDRNRGGRDDHRGGRRGGHWDNVCGPHRDWDGAHHRWFQHNRCERTWRNW